MPIIMDSENCLLKIIFAIEKLNNAEGTYYIMNRTKKNADDLALKNLPNVNLKPKVFFIQTISPSSNLLIHDIMRFLKKDLRRLEWH